MNEPRHGINLPEGLDLAEEAMRDRAYDFIKALGAEPTPDAISQLAGPFALALTIMCERGYDPHGRTWRRRGWRDLVYKIMDKTGRLKFHSWDNRDFDPDSAIDLMNFAGFYWRLRNQGPAWGESGEPS